MRRLLCISWLLLAVLSAPAIARHADQTIRNPYGPDMNGIYGGINGTGGLDGVSPYLNLFNPVISDFRGNILAEVTNGVVAWNPARSLGYGAVPGYRPVALGHGADISLASAWRGRWADITGYYEIGLRTYDPVAGMWLSYDSVLDPGNPNGCSAFGGDPINGFDSDGRFSKAAYQNVSGALTGLWNAYSFVGTIDDPNAALDIQQPEQNLENAVSGLANLGSQALQGNFGNVATTLTGGPNQSAAYRTGFAFTSLGMMAAGGEVGEFSGVGESASVAGTGTQAAEESVVAGEQASGNAGLLTAPPQPVALLPEYAEILTGGSADTVTPGWEISPYRQTTAGETFPRFESSQLPSRIGDNGSVTPGTFAGGQAGDASLNSYEANLNYNLPNPNIMRDIQYTITPPEGTWIIGPRPVEGGLGSEVQFPFGTPPGSATGPFPAQP